MISCTIPLKMYLLFYLLTPHVSCVLTLIESGWHSLKGGITAAGSVFLKLWSELGKVFWLFCIAEHGWRYSEGSQTML